MTPCLLRVNRNEDFWWSPPDLVIRRAVLVLGSLVGHA